MMIIRQKLADESSDRGNRGTPMKVSSAAKGRTLPKGACTASGHGHGVTTPIEMTLPARVIRSNSKC